MYSTICHALTLICFTVGKKKDKVKLDRFRKKELLNLRY